MSSAVDVQLEFTPNPDSLKYAVNRTLLPRGAKNFSDADTAKKQSGLAGKLFDIQGVSAVMFGTNFITVSVSNPDALPQINKSSIETIKTFLESGNAVIEPAFLTVDQKVGNLSEIEQKIIKILDEEVRPAVAMDGGDISFEKFEDGYVFLKMQGSCSGCPSSMMTLKMGVETRLKNAIPEIIEVIPV